MGFVIHWHESAMELRVFPIPIPPPTSLSTWFLWVFPVHQAQARVSCIPTGLVICLTIDNILTLNGMTPQGEKNNNQRLKESESSSVVSNSLRPHGLYSPWNSPGQNTGVGSLCLLQGIFQTQGLNPGLPHCRWILYQLSYQGSPIKSYQFWKLLITDLYRLVSLAFPYPLPLPFLLPFPLSLFLSYFSSFSLMTKIKVWIAGSVNRGGGRRNLKILPT